MHQMAIEHIDEMHLSPEDDTAIGTLLDQAFGMAEFDGRSYFQNRHHLRLLWREDEQIIGHVALSLRAIRMGETLIQAAGVAEVATHPDHRGKGIASALMESAIAAAKGSLADVMILFGDEPLYARLGFQPKPNRTLTVSMHDVRTGVQENRKDDGLMVLPLSDLDWDDTALIDLVGFAF